MDIQQLLSKHESHLGYCPICSASTIFVQLGDWLRDQYICAFCCSVPRWRALIEVLEVYFPDWRNMRIHESSPGGASSAKLKKECRHYVETHYYPHTPRGESSKGIRCEDLEQQTFPDNNFDLVITQDVFEHLFQPDNAFKEIARTLKSGGAHVFTVPWYHGKKTRVRAIRKGDTIEHLLPPEYHQNPIDPKGSLVTRDWGYDLVDYIYKASGMFTTVIKIRDRNLGLDGEMNEVFISRKT